MTPLKIAKRGGMLLISGDGKGCMNHCYIGKKACFQKKKKQFRMNLDNLVDGIVICIYKGKSGEAYNITDGGNTTW